MDRANSPRPVTAGYFDTMGIPVLRGRDFSSADTEIGPLVVIVNANMERTWWHGQNPIGQHIRFGDDQWRTIVGVVGDMHHDGLEAKPEPKMYGSDASHRRSLRLAAKRRSP